MKIKVLFIVILMGGSSVMIGQNTTANGKVYQLFSPGLWEEIGDLEDLYPDAQNYEHCNSPTEIVDVINPVTGKTWMDRNLGASRAATGPFDEQSYGSLFQWGRGADGHQCVNRYTGDGVTTSAETTTLSMADQPGHGDFITTSSAPNDWRSGQNNSLWQGGVNAPNNPCPSGYRLPTLTESNNERLSWDAPDVGENFYDSAFGSPVKFPAAGYRDFNGTFINIGNNGSYWTSTVAGNQSDSRFLLFVSTYSTMASQNRALGMSVRCIKDE